MFQLLSEINFDRFHDFLIKLDLLLTDGNEQDLNAVREILPQLKNRALVRDKAYSKEDFNEVLQKEAGSCIYTPVKLVIR